MSGNPAGRPCGKRPRAWRCRTGDNELPRFGYGLRTVAARDRLLDPAAHLVAFPGDAYDIVFRLPDGDDLWELFLESEHVFTAGVASSALVPPVTEPVAGHAHPSTSGTGGSHPMTLGKLGRIGMALAAVLVLAATPASAQKPKHAAGKQDKDPATVTLDVALSATKEILVKQGFEVVSVETLADRQIVTYRAGNQGKGRGKGPPVRMVIRRVENRIVLDDAPDALKLEIGVKLGIKL